MSTLLPAGLQTCQNVGCRSKATKQIRLQSGRKQWRCDGCVVKKTPSPLGLSPTKKGAK